MQVKGLGKSAEDVTLHLCVVKSVPCSKECTV